MPPDRNIMKSIMNGIRERDAKILLKGLRHYSQAYYQYDNGAIYEDEELTDEEADKLIKLTMWLAGRIGLDPEAGY